MSIRERQKPWLTLAMAGALAVGCSDDPAGLDDHGEEIDVIELVMSGNVVATYQVVDAASGTWTGQLDVDVGLETPHISVVFRSDDGDEIVFDSDHYLDVLVGDETIAEFEQDTPGELGGHLHGVAQGQTTVTFLLMHGAVGSGHEDRRTNPGVTASVN